MVFYAIWTKRLAFALDVYPEEIEAFLRDHRRQHIAGPFDTYAEAFAVARRGLQSARL